MGLRKSESGNIVSGLQPTQHFDVVGIVPVASVVAKTEEEIVEVNVAIFLRVANQQICIDLARRYVAVAFAKQPRRFGGARIDLLEGRLLVRRRRPRGPLVPASVFGL